MAWGFHTPALSDRRNFPKRLFKEATEGAQDENRRARLAASGSECSGVSLVRIATSQLRGIALLSEGYPPIFLDICYT